jgi:MinD-like ATPase involved in chromosome partitioning or flagellar assembly
VDKVSMNDGLDGRETIAFGLVAGEIAILILAMLSGYAVLHSGLAGAIAWSLAAVLLAVGACLAWGRLAGRPLLEWCVLLARFLVRTRHARAARLRTRWRRCRLAARASALRQGAWRARAGRPTRSPRPLQAGAVVIPLALRHIAEEPGKGEPVATPLSVGPLAVVRDETPTATGPAGDGRRRSHVVGFFSLCGGTGRTTLAVEVAAMLAAGGRAAAATWSPARRVALLDLAERSPGVGLRLGIPPPPGRGDEPPALSGCLVTHGPGLLVGLPAVSGFPEDRPGSLAAETLIRAAEDRGADVVVVDVDCDLGARCGQVLERCDQVMVTLTPTAGGVLDAYRSTAILRRMGLRDRIGYVVNRWRPGIDLSETMADLGGALAAEIPEDGAVVDAENRHRLAGRDGGGALSDALARLAAAVESAAGRGCWSPAAERWDSHAG